jgi:hypothetical protein
MKQYKFEGFPGHPVLKSFVCDYYAQLTAAAANAPAPKARSMQEAGGL